MEDLNAAIKEHADSGVELLFTLASLEKRYGKDARKTAEEGIRANRISVMYAGNGSRFKFWGSSFFRYCQELEATLEEHRKRAATLGADSPPTEKTDRPAKGKW
jgi:hypothetical protein